MLGFMGIGDNKFYRLACMARDDAKTAVVTSAGVEPGFTTSRGIK